MDDVTVVIPNWNGGQKLLRVLRDLGKQTQRPARVVVVDNGSDDGSANAAVAEGADLIQLGANRGFAAAVNAGVATCQSTYVAVINNDVELEAPWLDETAKTLRDHSGCWFAVGKIFQVRDRRRLDGTFDLIARSGCAWRAGHGREDSPDWRVGRWISLTPMTATLFRREIFEQLGPLDERFESYLEDVDFGLRASLAGLRGRYVPTAIAYHWGSATLGVWHPETVRRLARNQVYLVAKHYPAGWGWSLGWYVMAGQLLWGAVALRHGAAFAWVRGKWQGIRNWRRFRQNRAPDDGVLELLEAEEREIRHLQERTGYDRYWRIYLALTGTPANGIP